MTYWKAYYREDGYINNKQVGQGYSAKEIFKKAQETANRLNVVVTVESTRGSVNGLYVRYWKVLPKGEQK